MQDFQSSLKICLTINGDMAIDRQRVRVTAYSPLKDNKEVLSLIYCKVHFGTFSKWIVKKRSTWLLSVLHFEFPWRVLRLYCQNASQIHNLLWDCEHCGVLHDSAEVSVIAVLTYLYRQSTWCGSVCSGPGVPPLCKASRNSDRGSVLLLPAFASASDAPEGCGQPAAETLRADRDREKTTLDLIVVVIEVTHRRAQAMLKKARDLDLLDSVINLASDTVWTTIDVIWF